MPRGQSGRIVLEIDPVKKRRLYAVLDEEGMTLKEWFLTQLDRYVERQQPSLFHSAEAVNSEEARDDGDG